MASRIVKQLLLQKDNPYKSSFQRKKKVKPCSLKPKTNLYEDTTSQNPVMIRKMRSIHQSSVKKQSLSIANKSNFSGSTGHFSSFAGKTSLNSRNRKTLYLDSFSDFREDTIGPMNFSTPDNKKKGRLSELLQMYKSTHKIDLKIMSAVEAKMNLKISNS